MKSSKALRAIPRASFRALELARIQRVLERFHAPRLQMLVIVALTGAVGFLSSVLLLHSGMHRIWLRYPLAIAISYASFLLFLWCWLRVKCSDVLDGTDIPSGGSSPGNAGHGCGSGDKSIGTGGAGDHSQIFNATPDVDFGEGVVVLIAIAALGCAVWMACWLVWSAPALFAEILVDSALATGLYRHLRRAPEQKWVHTAFWRTAPRFALVAIVFGLAGAVMHLYAPEARSIGQVVHHHRLITSPRQPTAGEPSL
jgi:hypothetical protein